MEVVRVGGKMSKRARRRAAKEAADSAAAAPAQSQAQDKQVHVAPDKERVSKRSVPSRDNTVPIGPQRAPKRVRRGGGGGGAGAGSKVMSALAESAATASTSQLSTAINVAKAKVDPETGVTTLPSGVEYIDAVTGQGTRPKEGTVFVQLSLKMLAHELKLNGSQESL